MACAASISVFRHTRSPQPDTYCTTEKASRRAKHNCCRQNTKMTFKKELDQDGPATCDRLPHAAYPGSAWSGAFRNHARARCPGSHKTTRDPIPWGPKVFTGAMLFYCLESRCDPIVVLRLLLRLESLPSSLGCQISTYANLRHFPNREFIAEKNKKSAGKLERGSGERSAASFLGSARGV